MLPTSSPLIHTLELELHVDLDDDFPPSTYSDLICAINLIRLPVLATLRLSVDIYSDYPEELDVNDLPVSDFLPFLEAHPNLVDVTLSAHGTGPFPAESTFLPHLRSFQGSFADSSVICSSHRCLEKLSITTTCRDSPLALSSAWPRFNAVPLATHLTLNELCLVAYDATGTPLKIKHDLSPESFAELVSSFPNLTFLDACIAQPILAHIKICLLVDTLPASDPASDFDSESDWTAPWPEMRADYFFSVFRPSSSGDITVLLDEARINDSYSTSNIPEVTG
ncbi:hypothetical protein C8R46DRAFT_1341484 [Mycena filopes]|nr:hypothetical protein C8R46DRAFT_1341484 [Mycena filopes]